MTDEPAVASLDDFRRVIADLPGPSTEAAARAAAREPKLTKPPHSLGRLEDLTAWLAAWQGRHPPSLDRPSVRVFAGNHGVALRGVSAYPPEVTAQMVANFAAGGAAINQLCQAFGAELQVHPVELERPTRDFAGEPAMTDEECVRAISVGMETVVEAGDILCLGEMGIGNTTSAAALACALFGGDAADWTGPGTGVDGVVLRRKRQIAADAVRLHKEAATDAIDLLRRLGGREMAAIAGAVVGARTRRIPVLLDGFICTTAAAALEAYRPGALDHCQVGHVSAEPGHRRVVEALGKRPLLDLDMRLGEATGATLALAVVRAAAACHAGMATFDEAGVSDRPV